jgi:hypothetical protein
MTPQPPIVTAVCKEPEGIVVRYVYPLVLTPENLQKFWEKARKFPQVFGTEVKDFKSFCELFLSQEDGQVRAHGLFWVIDDFVGVYYMTHIHNTDALVHYSFFDRRHSGREELTKEMLRYVFRRFGFWRLSVEIPEYATNNTFGFTAALGFKKEGTKRNAIMFKDMKRAVKMYGLTREDALISYLTPETVSK